MTTIAGVIGVVIACTLLISTIKIKRSFPAKYPRRSDIRDQFTAFAESNRIQLLDTTSVARFMRDTADTSSYFSSTEILSMRHALQDNALLLIHYQSLDNDPHISNEVQSELVNQQNKTRKWFEESLTRIEALFEAETVLKPTATDVWKEFLNNLIRATRA